MPTIVAMHNHHALHVLGQQRIQRRNEQLHVLRSLHAPRNRDGHEPARFRLALVRTGSTFAFIGSAMRRMPLFPIEYDMSDCVDRSTIATISGWDSKAA